MVGRNDMIASNFSESIAPKIFLMSSGFATAGFSPESGFGIGTS
jgi:hypothetical protein